VDDVAGGDPAGPLPRRVEVYAMSEYPKPVPRLRSTVESVRSRCHRLMGSLALRWSNMALAMPMLPSEFSKSMGLTLCQGLTLAHLSAQSKRFWWEQGYLGGI